MSSHPGERHACRRDRTSNAVIWGIVLFVWGVGLWFGQGPAMGNAAERELALLLNLALGVGILWLYYGSWYEIGRERLFFLFGPFRMSLALSSITEIVPHSGILSGVNMGWSNDFLLVRIRGRKWGWKISPADRQGFFAGLIRADPAFRTGPQGLFRQTGG